LKRKLLIKNKVAPILFITLLLAVPLALLCFSDPALTGRFFAPSESFTTSIGEIYSSSSSYALNINESQPYNLKSVRISGSFAGDHAKVYLKTSNLSYVIFDSANLPKDGKVTDMLTGALTEVASDSSSSTVAGSDSAQPESPPSSETDNAQTDSAVDTTAEGGSGAEIPAPAEIPPAEQPPVAENQTQAPAENATVPAENVTASENITNETVPANQTQEISLENITNITNETIINKEVALSDVCEDSCLLPDGLDAGSYEIVIEVENGQLLISSLTYSLLNLSAVPIEINIEIVDSNNESVPSNITLVDSSGEQVPEEHSIIDIISPPAEAENTQSFEVAPSDENNLVVDVTTTDVPIKAIEFQDIQATEDVHAVIGVDNVPENQSSIPGAVQVYAIDPTQLDFTEAIVTVEATGSLLYKCANWDFASQTCIDGNWAFLQSITPGQDYNITLTADDPAYTETQQPNGAGKDTYLSSTAATYNYGAGTDMDIRADGSKNALIAFNLSNISSSARITSATLKLYVTAKGTADSVVYVHRLTSNWDEGTGTGSKTSDGATWNNNTNTTLWATAGGDYDSYIWANTTVTGTDLWFTWNVTNLVQNLVNGTYVNYGFLLRTNTTSGDTITFITGDNTNATRRPIFEVNYTTALNVTLVSPTPSNGNTTTNNWVYVNASLANGNATEAKLEFNGTNYTMTNASATPSNNWYYNITNLTNGNYSYKVYANDSGTSVFDVSETRNITVNADVLCTTLNTSNSVFTLTGNASSSGTCFTIGANNVTLDCQGYTVTYSTSALGYGVKNSAGYNFTTVKNCNFVEGSASGNSNHGVYYSESYNGTIYNNTIYTYRTDTYGVYLYHGKYHNVSNNTVVAAGNSAYNIFLLGASNSLINTNTLYANSGSSAQYALYLYNAASNNTLSYNTINTTLASVGIRTFSSTDYNKVIYNNVTTGSGNAIDISGRAYNNISYNKIIHLSGATYGVYLNSATNATVFYNDINMTGSSSVGIYLLSSANYNDIEFNNISSSGNGAMGIYIRTNSNSNYFNTNNILTNGSDNVGIRFRAGASDNILNNLSVLTFGTGASYPLESYDTSNNFTMYDSKVNASSGVADFSIRASPVGTWTFTNVTKSNNSSMNVSWAAGQNGTLTEYWYLDANVTSQNGTALSGANVSVYYGNSTYFGSNLTDSNGAARFTLLGFMQNSSTTAYYSAPYIVNVSKSLYTTVSNSSVNMTNNIQLNVNMSISDSTPPNITISRPQNTTYNTKTNLQLNYTATDDASVSACWYSLDSGSNTTLASCTNSTFNVSTDGSHNVKVYANDTYNNINSAIVYFSVDTSAPTVTIISPENKTYNIQNNIQLNYTATDNVAVDKCWYAFNGGTNTSLPGCSNSTISVGTDGSYPLHIYANDTGGNLGLAIQYFTVDTTPPQYSNPQSSTPAKYSSSTLSSFNITWTDALSSIGTVLFESNYSGAPQNYSMYLLSGNVYSYNATLPAGTFYWKAYANDSGGNLNASTQQTFTISKADNVVDLYLNGNKDQNLTITYLTQTNATGVASSGTANLYRDDVSVSNPEIVTLAAKTAGYKYVVNTTGSQNYTSNSTTFYVFINKASPTLSLLLDGAASDKTVGYGTQTNATGTASNAGDSDLTYGLYRNAANVSSGASVSDVQTLAANTYLYVYNTSGGENYTSATINRTLTINKAATSVKLFLNGNEGNNSQTYGTSSNATATLNVSGLTFQLLRNGTQVASGTDSISELGTLAASYYNYTASFDGNENYTGNSQTYFLTVNKTTPTLSLLLNGADSDISVSANTNITINSSSTTPAGATVYLYESGSYVANGTAPSIIRNYTTLGDRVWKVNISASENYTSTEKTHTVSVTDPDAPQYSGLKQTPASPATYYPTNNYQFNATWTDNTGVSDVILEFNGANYSYSAGQLNKSDNEYYKSFYSLAAGTYTYKWYANDTSNNWGKTLNQTYVLDKAITALFLTITPSNSVSYGTLTTISCSSNNLESSPTLTRNTTGVSNPDANVLAAGIYNYACTAIATNNYTSASATGTLTVSKAAPTINLTLNGQDSDVTLPAGGGEVNASATLVAPSSGDLNLTSAGVLFASGASPLQNSTSFTTAGTYTIAASYSGNDNYTTGSKSHNVIVQSAQQGGGNQGGSNGGSISMPGKPSNATLPLVPVTVPVNGTEEITPSEDIFQTPGIFGSAISVPPAKKPNPIYAVPTLLLMILLFAIVAMGQSKLSEKAKKILTALHVSLIIIIVLMLFFTFVKIPALTGGAVQVPILGFDLTMENLLVIIPIAMLGISLIILAWIRCRHTKGCKFNAKRNVKKKKPRKRKSRKKR